MLLAAHLPLTQGLPSVGWYVVHPEERVHLEAVETSESLPVKAGTPVTKFEASNDDPPPGEEPPAKSEEDSELRNVSAIADKALRRVQGRRIFDSAHRMPEIIGGIGSYYIHIEYPEEAMQAGVEGRLVLSFVVETSGHTTSVEVVETLHPACDSAAVRALRQTRFVPGRQNGDVVPVRMRLPVRFKLVTPGGDDSPAGSKSASS